MSAFVKIEQQIIMNSQSKLTKDAAKRMQDDNIINATLEGDESPDTIMKISEVTTNIRSTRFKGGVYSHSVGNEQQEDWDLAYIGQAYRMFKYVSSADISEACKRRNKEEQGGKGCRQETGEVLGGQLPNR
jgi:hypothetical protein